MPFCLIITGKDPEGYMISGLFFEMRIRQNGNKSTDHQKTAEIQSG